MSYQRNKISFSEKELEVVAIKKMTRGREYKQIKTPVSYRENFLAHYTTREPWFAACLNDTASIKSTDYAEKLARPNGCDSVDCFGVPWKWVESAGGAITPGGNPIFTDANEWKDHIVMPDIEKWNWEEDSKVLPDADRVGIFTFINGFWFERLISLMDFENAAMAIVDEDQQDAVKSFFEATTDLGIKLVDKICEYWPMIDGFYVHDDWGSQKAPFFSEPIAREMFLPYMKEFVGHIHSKGRFCNIHSCGHVEDRINIFIEAGIDGWQLQPMNDIKALYDNFGDKITVEVIPDEFDPADAAGAVASARKYVDMYCNKGKTAVLGNGSTTALSNDVFREELYTYSRKKYLSY